jgi:hypothetical protein
MFCSLIDNYFEASSSKRISEASFNPENLLSLIIDKIKEYNKLASENASEDEEEADPAVL